MSAQDEIRTASKRFYDGLNRVANGEGGELKMGGHAVDLEHRVTNIHRRESWTWKLVNHHTEHIARDDRCARPIASPDGVDFQIVSVPAT